MAHCISHQTLDLSSTLPFCDDSPGLDHAAVDDVTHSADRDRGFSDVGTQDHFALVAGQGTENIQLFLSRE